LAERQHVLALPGSIFGPDQDYYIRMAFANVDAALMPDIAGATCGGRGGSSVGDVSV